MRRATQALMDRIVTVRADLKQLETDLRAQGDTELASVMSRAYREIDHPTFTGAANTFGMAPDDTRSGAMPRRLA